MILVSLLVALYNKEKYVKRCIESLINQTYKNIEIIIVDDGSTDKSLEIVNTIKDSRIKIISIKNQGLAHARNVGIENAKGEYISFIDADDFLSPVFVDKLLKVVIENNTLTAWCGLVHVNFVGKAFFNRHYPNIGLFKITTDYILSKPLQSLNAGLISRSLFKNLSFNEKIPMFNEDTLVEYKILRFCPTTYFVFDCLYYYSEEDSSSITRTATDTKRYILRFKYAMYCNIDMCMFESQFSKKYAKKIAKIAFNTYCAYCYAFNHDKIKVSREINSDIMYELSKISKYMSLYERLILKFSKKIKPLPIFNYKIKLLFKKRK